MNPSVADLPKDWRIGSWLYKVLGLRLPEIGDKDIKRVPLHLSFPATLAYQKGRHVFKQIQSVWKSPKIELPSTEALRCL